MTIQGLENNYYLAGNNIWLNVVGFTSPVLKLELVCTNLISGVLLKKLVLYPNPNNEFSFNICEPIRALFINPDHLANNNIQQFSINFKAFFIDGETPLQEITYTKYFVRGYREKDGQKDWHLEDNTELIVKPWVKWFSIDLPGEAQKIQGPLVVNFIPEPIRVIRTKDCEHKIIKFRNSLGGYQYFIFSSWAIKNKSRPKGMIVNKTTGLRQNTFRNLGSEFEKTIELNDNTPFDLQNIVEDLVNSAEVYLFDPKGNDGDSSWIALDLDSNTTIKNNTDFVYDNKISFNIVNNINNLL